jgi:hypothetical protein
MNINNIKIEFSNDCGMEIIPLRISKNDKENKIISFYPKGKCLINAPNIPKIKPLSIKYRFHKWKETYHAFACHMVTSINPFTALIDAKKFVDNNLIYVEGMELRDFESIVVDSCLKIIDPEQQLDNLYAVPSQKTLRQLYFDYSRQEITDEIEYIEAIGKDVIYFLCIFYPF